MRPGSAVGQRLVRGSVWVLAGRGFGVVVVLATNALLTRLLSPDQVGAYFVVLSLVMFCALLAQMGAERTAVRLVAESLGTGRPGRARAAIVSVAGIVGGGALVVAILLVAGPGRWLVAGVLHSPLAGSVIGLTALLVVTTTVRRICAEIFRGFSQIHLATAFENLAAAGLTAVAFLLLWTLRHRVALRAVLVVSVAASGAAAAWAVLLVLRRVRALGPRDRSLGPRAVFDISWPLLFVSLALFVLGAGVDVWILSAFRSSRDVALYGAAVRLVAVVGAPLTILLAVLQPVIAELHARGERALLERTLRNAATVAAVPSALVVLVFLGFGGPVMARVFGPFYRHGSAVLAVLSLGQMANVVAGACGAALMMTGHQRTMMKITLCVAALSVTGGLVLVRPFGPVGVAASTAFAFTLQNVLMLGYAKRSLGIWTHVGIPRRRTRSASPDSA